MRTYNTSIVTITVILALTFILLNIADIFTTIAALHNGGKEANPFLSFSFKTLGTKPTIILKIFISLIVAGLFIYILTKKTSTVGALHGLVILAVVILFFTLAVTNNSLVAVLK